MTSFRRQSITANAPPDLQAIECVASSGMVSEERLSEEPKNDGILIEEWTEDTYSTSSKDPDEEQSNSELEIAAPDECVGSFGNIVVKNSSEVQFGNNTYYQGPVTIKQFVYKGAAENDKQLPIENGGTENCAFQTESAVINGDEKYLDNYKNTNQQKTVNKDNEKELSKGALWLNYLYRKRKLYSICISSVLTVLLISLTVLLVNKYNVSVPYVNYGDSDEQENNVPIPPPSGDSTLSGKLKIIPRLEWLAQPPEHPADILKLPVPYVIILHTATENCSDQAKCTAIVRYIQTYHMESRGWWDIGYNFLIGGDGYVYEGRGWKAQGANVYGYNSKSIGISFVGTFNKIIPPDRQILACKQLIEKGVKEGYIAHDYKLFAHRQLSSTQSPGEAFYQQIKTWPHWAEKP